MHNKQDFIDDAKKIKKYLADNLFGQDKAIEAIANSIKNNILKNTNAPKSTYLFLGPPATGKTYLAELMTKNLENYKIRKFDMTQYHDQNGGELYGYPIGWTGYGVGQLTGFVHNNPKSVIVLDSFEKAANVIQSNLLSIFEGGKMRDGCGWDIVTNQACNEDEDVKYDEENAVYMVDFTETIFIITSSLGKELYSDHKFIEIVDNDYIQAESMILETLKREEKRDDRSGGTQPAIVPELISRFSQANIVLFNKLNYKAYESISKKSFLEYKDIFCDKFAIKFNITSNFKHFLKLRLLIFAPELDARRIKNKVGVAFFSKITDYIMSLSDNINDFKEIKFSISKDCIDFINENINQLVEEEKLVKELFRKNITLEIQDKLSNKNGVITYKINSCKFKQVKRIKDFSDDGLVFDIPNVSFSDIAGHDKAKSRLKEVIKYFKEPKLLKKFNISPPKGMLLYGPTGTGKTLLAKAFAAEADLPFISITGIDLLKIDRMKRIFSKAKEYSPSIIFIDEIDTIGTRKSKNSKDIQINHFLSEMDGFSNTVDENIFVIAATNYKENIDSAMTRPGRIELHVKIDDLNKDARKYFIEKIILTKPTSGKFDMDKLLMYTAGATGAQLELIGKEASLYCLRHDLLAITQDILIDQINIVRYGKKLSNVSLEQTFKAIATSQAGHAIILKMLMPHIKIKQITIIPQTSNNGFILNNCEDLQDDMSIDDLKNKICISLAGRMSQVKKYGETKGINTRASNDLLQATKDVYNAISHYGMDKNIGHININGANNYKNNIDDSLKSWLKNSEEKTVELINNNWNKIENLTKLLLEKEVIYENQLNEFLNI